MINRAIILRATFAIFASAATFAACDDTPTVTEMYCNTRCACIKCTESELDNCNDDAEALRTDAFRKNCRTKSDEYLRCLNNEATCTEEGKTYDETVCAMLETALKECINAAPTCKTPNDGVCDEPAPLGTGTCPAGTDTADCTCTSTNDGVCDEPQGTGKCPTGTDKADCMGPTCATVKDGICDEPQGSGKCAAGTDTVDCTCPHQNNNVCDEPEGTGQCPEGSDPVDCTPCATANDGVCDEPQGTNKCPVGSDTVDCTTCATTNDGTCDEPQGTNKCPAGTDTADCSLPCVTCADYATTMQGNLCMGSDAIWQSLYMCACTGACMTDCGNSFCMGNTPNMACGMCLQNGACAPEFGACANDL